MGVALLLWLAVSAAFASIFVSSALLLAQPTLPGRADLDPATVLVAMLGDLAARLTGATTLGLLAAAAVFLCPDQDGHLPEAGRRVLRWAVRSGRLWFAASLLMTFAYPSFIVGVPIRGAFRPDAWWLFVTSTTTTLGWLASAIAALVAISVGLWARSASAAALAWCVGVAATVLVAVTGNVSVGLHHDWATDAAGLATIAASILTSAAVGAFAATAAGAGSRPAILRRYQRTVIPALAALTAGYGMVVWQQLAGTRILDTAYGRPVLVGLALLIALLASWVWRQVRRPDADAPPVNLVRSLARDLALLILALAALTAARFLPPPRLLVPQSIQVNFLGYEVNDPATLARLLALGRPNLLWVVLSVSAITAYLWGMVRVLRRGGRWPVGRLIFWLAGWLLTAYLAVTGLWIYSTAVFSWHMLVHMTVNMMVPVLCVLGAPLTLVRAASGPSGDADLPTARELLDDVTSDRVVRVLLSPPLVWAVYIFSLYAVYFSPAFPWLMKYHWGHQLMLLHFMVVGYAFFALLVGPDRHPWPLPYLVKFALLVSVMPFHAIFAVGIMSARSVLGGEFYRSLDIPWVGDLLAEQNVAGQITWITGEVPAFVAVIMLAFQWFRSDEQDAVAVDQLLDQEREADELDAYNGLLAELARRDRASDSHEEW